ncbi:hypothetical protein N865_16065 [Intrasporangium oryzae NRRL B-24470]|uniref:ATP-grasp domain-containing protein n=1 Tax=Intrasporangium oryzae NRRL B-24470 TaxID=1386089 RepID=W9G6E7_9MICO|nr:hypothetical protein N865_16065 [Intrasporangium oryzae NRRL B-24470]
MKTVWWRRLSRSVPTEVEEDIQLHLIGNDCEAALIGVFETDFSGTWIDHPTSIRRAENKLVQLRLAHEMGLSHPATLVTQDAARLCEFVAEHERVVAKVLRGTNTAPLATVSLDATRLPLESVRMAPTIFQEEVRGSSHLRVVVFGEAVYAFRITSPHLDWRPYTDTAVELVQLDPGVEMSLKRFLVALHLRMGSFDLKIKDDGEVVFLEVNPQGQFLFLQSKTGVDLATACAEYLASSPQGAA